jgi:hypothetical protein
MNGKQAIIWGLILTFGSIALMWLLSMITVVN